MDHTARGINRSSSSVLETKRVLVGSKSQKRKLWLSRFDFGGSPGASAADQTPRAVVVERLPDLVVGVHHEGAAPRDGLAERARGEQQAPPLLGVAVGFEALARSEHRQLAPPQLALRRADAQRALDDVDEGGVPCRKIVGEARARGQRRSRNSGSTSMPCTGPVLAAAFPATTRRWAPSRSRSGIFSAGMS